ncbi:hypothetical protein M427DRAFT_268313 [Gonapodya prolifera JEL478]|uniref:Uncharacterized protein n=1 Tax=Gonapodya prolifera (strain JEL478) TaxID=1344416 RepID=A0A139AK92_GONPJ|nr:hypothetical protein M427DRAFT_268313 [Gonapodya prolifera JEL478]|eukprot:KXS16964.1 hypothetical protein M427DRAFT_268313 [Gonapodya prolifera JEL478]
MILKIQEREGSAVHHRLGKVIREKLDDMLEKQRSIRTSIDDFSRLKTSVFIHNFRKKCKVLFRHKIGSLR